MARQSRTFNALNQETTGGTSQFDYDGNGSSIKYRERTHLYDVENRLTQVNAQSGSLLLKADYRWDGKRAWKENAGGTRTYFVYDGDTVVQEVNSDGTTKATYTWGATGLLARTANGTTTWYSWDLTGNIAQKTSDSGVLVNGYSVTAWGNRRGDSASDDPYAGMGGQYGYYTDYETGYILCTHRYYDPAGGRWLTRDPIGYDDGMSMHAYVGNNPVNAVDPSGLQRGGNAGPVWRARAPKGHGRGVFNIEPHTYYGSNWVHQQKRRWQKQNCVDVYINHGGDGEYDYKSRYDHVYDHFWVNNRWLTPGEFGNYAAGYAGSWTLGLTGNVLMHFFGEIYEKKSQMEGETRADGYHRRPVWVFGDGAIDTILIQLGACEAMRYKAHLQRLEALRRKVLLYSLSD